MVKRSGCPPKKKKKGKGKQLPKGDETIMVLSFQENECVNDTRIILEFYLYRPNSN